MQSVLLLLRFVYYEKYKNTDLLQKLACFLSFSCILLLYFPKYHVNIAFIVNKLFMFHRV